MTNDNINDQTALCFQRLGHNNMNITESLGVSFMTEIQLK